MPAFLHAILAILCRRTPFLPKRGRGGTPFYLNACLTNWCRHTPCFLNQAIGVCLFIYMQLLKHMETRPLVPETGREIHQVAYVQVFQISATICLQWYMRFLHMEVFQMDADIPLCSRRRERRRSAYFISNSCRSMSTNVSFQKVGFIRSVLVQVL